MRLLPALVLTVWFGLASAADARLFWQTYGSTVATADGCAWNANQDYFVPRYASSTQYGLFSPCKTSHTCSPACKYAHPLYPGYCGIYGACHYRHRNHLYGCRCGCTPLSVARPQRACRRGCGATACGARSSACGAESSACGMGCSTCGGASYYGMSQLEGYYADPLGTLPNVESSAPVNLGSIPVEGGEPLSQFDFMQLNGQGISPQQPASQGPLPLLGAPARK